MIQRWRNGKISKTRELKRKLATKVAMARSIKMDESQGCPHSAVYK